MTVVDTSIVIERYKKGEKITENIVEPTLIEFPPIILYRNFYGKVLVLEREDVLLAIELQRRLRAIGKPKPLADLLIAAICINREEKLVTKDKNFLDIKQVSNLDVEIID